MSCVQISVDPLSSSSSALASLMHVAFTSSDASWQAA